MQHSKSFPSASAWFSAVRLFFPAYVCATVVFALLFWSWLFMAVVTGVSGHFGLAGIFAGFALFALLGGFVWFILVRLIYRILLSILWSNPPLWLTPDKCRAVFHHFWISFLATIPIAIAFLPYVLFTGGVRGTLPDLDYYEVYASKLLIKMSWLWFILAAYLYHYDYLVRHSQKQKRMAKARS